jgi:hypothetical protein
MILFLISAQLVNEKCQPERKEKEVEAQGSI